MSDPTTPPAAEGEERAAARKAQAILDEMSDFMGPVSVAPDAAA